MFPEGLHNNSLIYDYAYDVAWPSGDMALAPWLSRYTAARYGRSDPAMTAAWQDVVAGAYDVRYWTPRWWNERAGAYLFFKRPAADAPTYPAEPGDRAKLRAGIAALLKLAPAYGQSPLYRYDLVDLTRHAASLSLDDSVKAAVAAYQKGDVATGDRETARVKALALAIDHLIGGQQESLASWIADARAYGDTPAEKTAYEQNAKAQVTIWGGRGHLGDYASKAWAGMYADYYLPRWTCLSGRGSRRRARQAAGRRCRVHGQTARLGKGLGRRSPPLQGQRPRRSGGRGPRPDDGDQPVTTMTARPERFASLDMFRGATIFLMIVVNTAGAGGALHSCSMRPGSASRWPTSSIPASCSRSAMR